MQNSENIDTSNFAQKQNLADLKYNNYAIHNQYRQSNFKNDKERFSSGEVCRNFIGYDFLTEKNNNYYGPLVNDSILPNYIKYYKEYNYPSTTHNNIDFLNISYNTQRNKKTLEPNFINNLSNNNIHEIKKCFNNCNEKKTNYSKIVIKMNSDKSNRVQYNRPINFTSNDIKNLSKKNNNQMFIKITKNTYDLIHNKSKNNILNNKYFNNISKNNLKTYINEKNISINNHNQTYNNDYTINLTNQRNNNNFNILKHNNTIINTDTNNYKVDKLTFNNNIKEEIKSQKPSLNISNKNDKNNSLVQKKNIQIKMVNMEKCRNTVLSPRFENNKKKFSLMNNQNLNDRKLKENHSFYERKSFSKDKENNKKKFSLMNNPNLNDRKLKYNHSFYERKSFSKDKHQEKNPQTNSSSIIPNKKKQIILKINQENKHLIKYNSNNSIIKLNNEKHPNNKTIKRIYSSKLNNNNIKEEKNNNQLNSIKKHSKRFIENFNNYDVNLNEIKSVKENINSNNVNILQNERNNSYKYLKINDNHL